MTVSFQSQHAVTMQFLLLQVTKEVRCKYETLTTVKRIYQYWHKDYRLSSLFRVISQMAQKELKSQQRQCNSYFYRAEKVMCNYHRL